MGYTIPGWLDEVLDFIGINFPNVDEDDYREMADAMREFAKQFEGHGGDAHKAVSRILSSSEGWAVDAMETHWNQVKASHLEKLPELARLFADACDALADIIFGMKTKAEAELAIMAGSLGISVGLAVVTGGLSAVIGAAEIAAMRQVIKRIIDEAVDRIVEEVLAKITEPINAKLESMVEDMVLDLAEGAFSMPPATGGTGESGGRGGHGGMQLASAGGGSGSGGAGGGQKTTKIDHTEFEDGAGKVSRHGGELHLASSSPLSRAKGAFGRSKGRDPFTQTFDSVLHGALKGSEKALGKVAKHVTETVPDRVKATSRLHKHNDIDVRNRADGIHVNKGDGGGGSRSGGSPAAGRKPDDGLKIDSAKLSRQARELEAKETCGDPIDMASGQMILAQSDVELPGVLPLVLRRTHLSGYAAGRSFGPSWAATLDERLEKDDTLGGYWWYREDGSALAYPRLPDLPGDRVGPAEGVRLPLTYVTRGSSYVLTAQDPHSGLIRHFEPAASRDGVWWLVGVEDRNGNSVDVERDEHDVPLTVTHSGGYEVRVDSVAEQGRVTGLSVLTDDEPVQVRSFLYDDVGDLIEVRNAVDAATRFTYDDAHRVTGWRDSNATEFTYAYDAGGRVVETRGTDGILNSRVLYGDPHEDGTSTVTYTDSLGHATVYRANRHGQIIAITDPLGHTTTQQWDRRDHLLSHTDPLGRTARWDWDDDGNLITVTAPDGAVTRIAYNALHLPVSLTGPDGAETRLEYDERGNRTAVIGPDGAIHRFAHHVTGAPESITDPLGATLRLEADAAGLPVAVVDARGARTVCRRDAFGQPLELTDALGRSSHFVWDAEGRLRARTAPNGSSETWEWDGEGNCLRHTDPLGGVTSCTFGPFDLLSSRTTPDGRTHTFVHDTEQRLVQVVNPAGLTWTYEFDPVGRVLTETDFDGRVSRCSYDPAGQLVTRTNAAGQDIAFEFDDNSRLAAKTVGSTRTTFSYDAASQLTAAESPQCTLEFSYDVAGRLLTQTVDGAALRLGYDPAGRRISRTTPTGALTELGWDEVGNRTALTVDGRHTLAFGHDLLGRETERTVGESLHLTSDWDAVGRLTGHSLTAQPGRRIRARSYAYRADDHLTAVHEEVTGRGTTYALDPIGRPLRAAGPAGPETYAYDASGNQRTADWPDGAADPAARGERDYTGTRLIRAGHTHYRYDDAGRLVERVKKRLSRKPDVWHYAWDAENRLTSCTTPDGSTWHYRYDPLGRRTAKYRLNEAGSVIDETRFTWDGPRLAEQTTTDTDTTLTWDHDGFRPLIQYERKPLSDEEVDSRFFAIVSDLVGTPTELVDESGAIAWHTRATVWGTTAVNPDATAHTPLRHPGQYADPETGLHYNYFRHYDPETARYVSPDPLGLTPAPNPVAYVDNPLDLYDPLGLAPCRKDHYASGGSVRYKPLDHLGRPTGVSACIRPEMLKSGSPAGQITPPGWRGHGTAFNEARGHLLADRLGGAGKHHNAKHNLVTQTQDPVNTPYQRDMIEGEIYKAVKKGEIVQYDVTPVYEGTNPIPIRLEYSAHGNQGFELTGWLDNPAAGVRTAVPGWSP
ncbi:DUF6531 domain-containing protein [Streptomyces sp. NBC_01231]|nr:DUF6531 domain-containing protein [Streptomyces sp. NBC_01231]